MKQKILGNLSQRAAEMLLEDLEQHSFALLLT
jgi:flagellar motor switch protein FliG